MTNGEDTFRQTMKTQAVVEVQPNLEQGTGFMQGAFDAQRRRDRVSCLR